MTLIIEQATRLVVDCLALIKEKFILYINTLHRGLRFIVWLVCLSLMMALC